MPATYDWSKTPKSYLDKNDKIGLLIGSILAGGMGAATGQGGRDSVLRGLAGATAGFGGGANALEDNYSKMIKESLERQQQEYEQTMQNDVFGLNKEKFVERKRQFEESDKPYREAERRWKDSMSRNTDFDNQMALQKLIDARVLGKKNERFDTQKRQREARIQKNKVVESRPGRQKETEFESYLKLTPEQKAEYEKFKSAGKSTGDDYDVETALDEYGKAGSSGKSTNIPSREDLEFTAKKYGITTDEVLKRMRK